jgi:hypothetical protein
MANDPTQYQPPRQQPPYQSTPYDQTRSAPSFQPPPPPYQQPAYAYAPPPNQGQPSQGKNASRPWLKTVILGAVIIALMLLTIVGVAIFAARAHAPGSVVNDYYSTVKQQDYSKAFSYVRFPAARGNQGFSLYVAVAQALDKTRGPVSSYSEQGDTNSDTQAIVFETVQRGNSSYTVRLVLMQFGGEWKISSFTTI